VTGWATTLNTERSIDNRRHARHVVSPRLYVVMGMNGSSSGGILHDVSDGGLSLDVFGPEPAEEQVVVEFELSETGEHFEGVGKVIWKNEVENRIGLQFVDLPEAYQVKVRNWLSTKSKSGEPLQSVVVLDPRDATAPEYSRDELSQPSIVSANSAATETAASREDSTDELAQLNPALTLPAATEAAATSPEDPTSDLSQLRTAAISSATETPATETPATETSEAHGPMTSAPADGASPAVLQESEIPGTAKDDPSRNESAAIGANRVAGVPERRDAHVGAKASESYVPNFERVKYELSPALKLKRKVTRWMSQHIRRNVVPLLPILLIVLLAIVGLGGKSLVAKFLQSPAKPTRHSSTNLVVRFEKPSPAQLPNSSSDPPLPESVVKLFSAPLSDTKAGKVEEVPEESWGELPFEEKIPEYPSAAVNADLQGKVVLHAIIAKNGTLRDLRVVSGPPVLSDAALEAVKKWRYLPHYQNSKLVEVDAQIVVEFELLQR
jgi:TonB family protein